LPASAILSLADPQWKNMLHLLDKEYSEARILCQADPLTRHPATMIGLDMRRWFAHNQCFKNFL